MSGQEALQAFVTEKATELGVPGLAVGVFVDGEELYAFHGVTSTENPRPVDATTLFQFGSTGKTFTATAIMRLVEQGKVELGEKVRTYVPELVLKDESVAAEVTVLHLLNHTAGWDGDLFVNTGDGDDALEKIIAKMADIEQLSPLGSTVSYNNAALYLAGRVIEKVTGTTYEQAISDLILEPLGLKDTWFFPNDIMTRSFAVGHTNAPDGTVTVARPWALARSAWAAGGITANAADQIAWVKFHLGDGKPLLTQESLDLMKQPTADMAGNALGDAVGISWLLKDVAGLQQVGHGGTTHGQHSEFVMVPERGFGLISLTNCGPSGPQFNTALHTWAFEHFLGVKEAEPDVVAFDADLYAPFAGTYETIAAFVDLTVGDEGLLAKARPKAETAAALGEQDDPEEPPVPLGLLVGGGVNYVVTGGPAQGMRGYFVREEDGTISGVNFGGRLAKRI